ncbi:dTDP-glucose 4,6-dehydratase [Acrocarpospora corrugata]|uniref:dTDP-glucose 4,6-dehydratase n=1 Tax=Acrocarpospora corrugata TaxID=35763 RepID=A0A5M3VRL0_9ACTN|nr:NAD-dependent epimerase/dehydratase family protein [Acrocarpospora corrugata]GER99414.1 dTDP-glucose 4,6-dehydratase [Acrocarpospora corrugata]
MTSSQPEGRIVVTGGAGFIGAHLCSALLARGDRVTAVDNLLTGRSAALDLLRQSEGFAFVEHDVTEPLELEGPVRAVVHLAGLASPVAFFAMPLETLRVGSIGTLNVLELARAKEARFILASSSEVYGDPEQHPQKETYRGNVDPVGPRSAYDESKRFSEAATVAYRRHHGLDTGIVRPFNVYGPGMWPDDGRIVAAFSAAAIRGEPLRLHGDGKQTRSLCYVGDFVQGLIKMLDSDLAGPVNLGSADEASVREIAELVVEISGTGKLEFLPARDQDVNLRRPDLTRAREDLDWEATTSLRDGLAQTVAWMREQLAGKE